MILSTLKLQKQDEQRRRIDGLDAIRDALLGTTTQSTNKEYEEESTQPSYGTNKAKKALVTNEVERMSLVLQHPAFKADPFTTMQEHIRNTLVGEREKLEAKTKELNEQDKLKQEERKRLKKERLQGVKKSKKKYKAGRTKS